PVADGEREHHLALIVLGGVAVCHQQRSQETAEMRVPRVVLAALPTRTHPRYVRERAEGLPLEAPRAERPWRTSPLAAARCVGTCIVPRAPAAARHRAGGFHADSARALSEVHDAGHRRSVPGPRRRTRS